MVASEIVSALAGLAGTVLGVVIQYYNSRRSAEEASQRIFEKRVADAKFERLEKLHDDLNDCVDQFGKVIYQGPENVDDYSERVRKPYDEFVDSFEKARFLLTPEERETIDSAREELNEIRADLRMWAQDIDEDWQDNSFQSLNKTPKDVEEIAEPVYWIVRKNLDPEVQEDC